MVCYPDVEHASSCPITMVKFVETIKLDQYTNFTKAAFNDSTTLIWKKDTDNLPITTFKLESSQPCTNPYY